MSTAFIQCIEKVKGEQPVIDADPMNQFPVLNYLLSAEEEI